MCFSLDDVVGDGGGQSQLEAAAAARQVHPEDRAPSESVADASRAVQVGTVPFRAFELLCGDVGYTDKVDVFSFALVLANLCGFDWDYGHGSDGEVSHRQALRGLMYQLGTPTIPALVRKEWVLYPPGANTPKYPKREWPDHMWQTLGLRGVDLLEKVLVLRPSLRASAAEAFAHNFFDHRLMQLAGHCVPSPDLAAGPSRARSSKAPLGGAALAAGSPLQIPSADVWQPLSADQRASLSGKRHAWNIKSGLLEPDVLEWLRNDPDIANFLADEAAFAAGAGDTAQQLARRGVLFAPDERKMVLAMDMNGVSRGEPSPAGKQCMNGLSLTAPLGRVAALRNAFLMTNSGTIALMTASAKKAARACESLGRNGEQFLEIASKPENWLYSAGELHVTKGSSQGQFAGFLQEPAHQDGSGSLLLAGLTLYGHRVLRCEREQPDAPSVLFEQRPGSFYIGQLTGPRHQVLHMPLASRDLMRSNGGLLSMSVILRCNLFPHDRARNMNTTPSPRPVFEAMAESFRESVAEKLFVLPSLEDCLACYASPPVASARSVRAVSSASPVASAAAAAPVGREEGREVLGRLLRASRAAKARAPPAASARRAKKKGASALVKASASASALVKPSAKAKASASASAPNTRSKPSGRKRLHAAMAATDAKRRKKKARAQAAARAES